MHWQLQGLWHNPNFVKLRVGRKILIGETSLRQILVPNHLLGRVNASIQFLTQGSMPVSALLAGVLTTTINI